MLSYNATKTFENVTYDVGRMDKSAKAGDDRLFKGKE